MESSTGVGVAPAAPSEAIGEARGEEAGSSASIRCAESA